MLIFMKNIKKILSRDEALSVIRYHAGRAYVSSRYSCIWVEEASGREGTFDLQSNLMCENAAMPNYDKLLPPIIGSEPYTIVCENELTEFLAAMKPVNAYTEKADRDVAAGVAHGWAYRVYAQCQNGRELSVFEYVNEY